jgi:hypothetical protein
MSSNTQQSQLLWISTPVSQFMTTLSRLLSIATIATMAIKDILFTLLDKVVMPFIIVFSVIFILPLVFFRAMAFIEPYVDAVIQDQPQVIIYMFWTILWAVFCSIKGENL